MPAAESSRTGAMPLRPSVHRAAQEFEEDGFRLVVCSVGGGDEVCPFAEEDAGEEAETGVAGELFCAVAAGGGLGLQFGNVCVRFEERDVFAAAEGAEEVAVPVGFDAAQAVVEVCAAETPMPRVVAWSCRERRRAVLSAPPETATAMRLPVGMRVVLSGSVGVELFAIGVMVAGGTWVRMIPGADRSERGRFPHCASLWSTVDDA